MAEFHSSIQELINAASTTSAAANFISTVNEFALASDSLTRRLLWEIINDFEVTDWNTINTADSSQWANLNTAGATTWDTINNSESTAWGTINTSDAGGWQVIKTQP
jgi:hypothetical protein